MEFELLIFLFIFIGLISGLLAGLLGIGGGVITVPFLYYIFHYSELIPNHPMQFAVGTSLAASCVASGVSTFFQIKKHAVEYSALRLMTPTLILGCIFGSLIALHASSTYLRIVFAGVAILLGIYLLFPKLPNLYIAPAPDRSLAVFGLLIGTLSSMLGIGGGSISFPIFLGYQLQVNRASATASASTFITTFFGSILFLMIAWKNSKTSYALGYIQLPAFFAISAGAILTSPIGVRMSRMLPVSQIKRSFGVCLILVGLAMIFI
jgi:uncharacterized membrane protein YfcA